VGVLVREATLAKNATVQDKLVLAEILIIRVLNRSSADFS
jgi:hypothetical protein